MSDLRDRCAKLDPESLGKMLDRIRDQFEDSEFADLVKWCFEKFEEMCIAQIKGYGGRENESLWNCVGRLQGAELLKTWIFARSEIITDEENEENPNA
jgi:hypothetical protein